MEWFKQFYIFMGGAFFRFGFLKWYNFSSQKSHRWVIPNKYFACDGYIIHPISILPCITLISVGLCSLDIKSISNLYLQLPTYNIDDWKLTQLTSKSRCLWAYGNRFRIFGETGNHFRTRIWFKVVDRSYTDIQIHKYRKLHPEKMVRNLFPVRKPGQSSFRRNSHRVLLEQHYLETIFLPVGWTDWKGASKLAVDFKLNLKGYRNLIPV